MKNQQLIKSIIKELTEINNSMNRIAEAIEVTKVSLTNKENLHLDINAKKAVIYDERFKNNASINIDNVKDSFI